MKRKLAILLIVIMLVSALSTLLVACQNSNDGLRLYLYSPDNNKMKAVYNDMLQEFTNETGIKVNAVYVAKDNYNTKLQNSFSSGDKSPDVFYLDQPVLSDIANLCLDLSEGFFAEEGEEGIHLSDFYQCALDTVYYKGKVLAVPFSLTTSIILYNKDLVTSVPKDWEEWINTDVADGKALFGGLGSAGYLSWYFQAFLKSAGGDLVKDGQVTFNDEHGVAAAQMIANLYAKSPQSVRDSANAFTNGNVYYRLAHNSDIYNAWASNPTFCESSVGATLFIPQKESQTSYSNIGGENIAIAKNSSNIEGAKKLVKFLLREENVDKAIANNFSANKNYAKVRTSDPVTGAQYSQKLQETMAVVLEQLNYATARPVVKGLIEVNDNYLAQALASILDNNANIQESLDLAKQQAERTFVFE